MCARHTTISRIDRVTTCVTELEIGPAFFFIVTCDFAVSVHKSKHLLKQHTLLIHKISTLYCLVAQTTLRKGLSIKPVALR